MSDTDFNKYRAAIEVLQQGRDQIVDSLADEILDHADDLTEYGYHLNELLETQGTRLHFLCLLVAQLEQSAEALDEAQCAAPQPPPEEEAPKRRRKPRAKKLSRQTSPESTPDDA